MIRQTLLAWFASLALAHLANSAELSGSQEDRQAISDLIAEYAYRWDRKDIVAFSELFASDGGMDWVFAERVEETRVVGRANILAYAREAQAERIGDKQSRHHFTNLIFRELGSDRAITENMVFVTHQAPDSKPEIITTGYYRIVWTKLDDKWLIAQRTLYLDR